MNKELIITVLILVIIYQAYQQKKTKHLPTNTDNSARTVFELGEDQEDLIAEKQGVYSELSELASEKDAAVRSKNETEQELIAVSNKLKLKNQEVTRKEQEITRLKSEKSQVEISLNSKIKELKTELRATKPSE
jgi:hypothetical protein